MAEAEENVKAAEVVEEKKDQWSYMCTTSEELDDMSLTLKQWRKLGKGKENGDWVMITTEPLQGKQKKFKFVWIASPDNPGKGGPAVACHAAWIALMYGRCFDIGLDVSTKEKKAEALAVEPEDFPLFKYPNGEEQDLKKKVDSDDEDEWWGTPVVFFVRYQGEIYSADTLTDGPSLNVRQKMKWATNKDNLLKSCGIQDKFHLKKLHDPDLVNGKALFKARYQKHMDGMK